VGKRAGTPVVGGGYTWVPNTADGTITKIDQGSNRVVATVTIGDANRLYRERCADVSVHSYPVGNFDVRRCDLPSGLAYYAGSLWVLRNDTGEALRIDPGTDRVLAAVPLPGEPFGLAAGRNGVWVTDFQHDTVTEVDPVANRVVRVLPDVGKGPSGVLATAGAVWVTLSRENALLRLDPATGTAVTKLLVGTRPLAMVSSPDGAVWVRNEKSSSLARVDPRLNRVAATVPVDVFLGRDGQDGLALAGGRLWTSGLVLDEVDPASHRVVRRFQHMAITLAGGGRSLWTTDLTGTVSRVDV
jgi:streptogramin lyase